MGQCSIYSTHTHTCGVGGLPEADCGEGGEGGERRSHGQRSRGTDVVLTAQDIIYIYIYIYVQPAATFAERCVRVCAAQHSISNLSLSSDISFAYFSLCQNQMKVIDKISKKQELVRREQRNKRIQARDLSGKTLITR